MNSMLSKSKTSAGRSTSFSTSAMHKKKKPAPPRPPLPTAAKIQTSQSFSTGSELKNRLGQRSLSVSGKPDMDLIDFSAPFDSRSEQPRLQSNSKNEPPDYRYRVGASIFFVKSPLMNSVSHNSSKAVSTPFSPPRPSAQALSNSTNNSQHYTSSTTSNQNQTKYISRPTIIKAQPSSSSDGMNQAYTNYGNQSKTSTTSTTVNVSSSNQNNLYSNVPLEWDEPPKKFPQASTNPTIIKPLPPPKKPGLGSKAFNTRNAAPTSFSVAGHTIVNESKPYYDEPPEFDDFDDDDDDDDDDDFDSNPMPTEPPPPPPQNYEVEEWIDNTQAAAANSSEYGIYSEPQDAVTQDRAYAIALYDYNPEAEGDLALQAGDLIYLTRKIDESWLCGSCGGIEGMFPSNYVNVVVPLPDLGDHTVPDQNNSQSNVEQDFVTFFANIDYDFVAETETDLNLQVGGVVTILGRINEDWLYGEIQGSRGQFPASFVSPVPLDLPTLTF